MKDLRCVTLHFYYKIVDSEMFGGEGTVGYVSASNGESLGSEKMPFDEIVSIEGFNSTCDAYRKIISYQMDVPLEKIIPISRDEYKDNTEDEE